MKIITVVFASFALFFSLAQVSHAGKLLTGDEIKTLVTDKTLSVTVVSNGKQWRQYHAADGSSFRDNGETSKWHVEKDKHCSTAATYFPCALIQDNGDGTYARVQDNGDALVIWSKIVDGKAF